MNPGVQSLLQEIPGQSPTNTAWCLWGKESRASQAGKETEPWPLLSRQCSAAEYLLVATCASKGKGCSAVPRALSPHPPVYCDCTVTLDRAGTQGTYSASPAARTVTPTCITPTTGTCKTRRGCVDASDSCDTVTPANTESDALSQESCVNISVLRDLSSAVSCHFPDPTNSAQATCPAVVWDSTPVRMNGWMDEWMDAILRQGTSVIPWRCSNETKKGAFCYVCWGKWLNQLQG